MAQTPNKIVDDTIRIGEGEYFGSKFQGPANGFVEISARVLEGPKVDLSLTDERGYQNYVEGMQFREYEESPTTSVKETTIKKPSSSKMYVLIIENNGGEGLLSSLSSKQSVVDLSISSIR